MTLVQRPRLAGHRYSRRLSPRQSLARGPWKGSSTTRGQSVSENVQYTRLCKWIDVGWLPGALFTLLRPPCCERLCRPAVAPPSKAASTSSIDSVTMSQQPAQNQGGSTDRNTNHPYAMPAFQCSPRPETLPQPPARFLKAMADARAEEKPQAQVQGGGQERGKSRTGQQAK